MGNNAANTSLIALGAVRSIAAKVLLVLSCVCILGGSALFVYAEQAVGIGPEGVTNKLLGGCGFALAGVGMLIVGIFFVKQIIVNVLSMSHSERSATAKKLAKQFLVGILNVVVYVGIFILFMGGVSALDGASAGTVVVVFAVWALCITAFVLYRRYRKKHKVSYNLLTPIAVTALILLLSVFLIAIFVKSDLPNAMQDLAEGSETADVFLVEAEIDHSSARYRALVQDTHRLTFYTADGERIVLVVPDKDIAAAKPINDYGNFVHLEYYPRTQVFCDATPWYEGRQIMGADLMNKLQEEYEFDL